MPSTEDSMVISLNNCKTFTSAIFTIYHITALHELGLDWLAMQTSVAEAAFMNEFPFCEMFALLLQEFHETLLVYRNNTCDMIKQNKRVTTCQWFHKFCFI